MVKKNSSGQVQLNSSFLTSMKWKGSTLTVNIGDKSYDFIRVPMRVIKGLRNADSPGRFFNDKLKGKYQKPMD